MAWAQAAVDNEGTTKTCCLNQNCQKRFKISPSAMYQKCRSDQIRLRKRECPGNQTHTNRCARREKLSGKPTDGSAGPVGSIASRRLRTAVATSTATAARGRSASNSAQTVGEAASQRRARFPSRRAVRTRAWRRGPGTRLKRGESEQCCPTPTRNFVENGDQRRKSSSNPQ